MSGLAKKLIASSGGEEKLYVDDVFSTYLYTGNGSTQTTNNGIQLGDSTGVCNFDGYSSIVTPAKTNTTFGTSDYIIEAFVYMTSNVGSEIIVDLRSSSVMTAPALYWNGAAFSLYTNQGALVLTDPTPSSPLNVWTHVAVSRVSGTTRLFVNGVQKASAPDSISYTCGQVSVGRSVSPGDGWVGKLSNVRVVKGAGYATNFTPPASNLEYIIGTGFLAIQYPNPLVDIAGGVLTVTNVAPSASQDPFGQYLAGKGGLVWSKFRGGVAANGDNMLVHGSTSGYLVSNKTDAINTSDDIIAFNSNGYSFGNITGWSNESGRNYVSWTFRNADRFFTYTTVSHTNGTPTNINLSSLGTVGQVHAKITNTTGDWIAWHRSLTAGNNLRLNTTAAQTTTTAWLSVSGTTATLSALAPTGTYVIHAWAHDDSKDGIIQCGSFTTDGSGNATVNLGWEPQWVNRKIAVGGSGNWRITDSMRGFTPVGSNNPVLLANTSDAEFSTGSENINSTSTGFTFQIGTAGATYIYLAIRRPNKPPTSGTEVYKGIAATSDTSPIFVGFPSDFVLDSNRSGSAYNTTAGSRLTGSSSLLTTTTAAEVVGGFLGASWQSNTEIKPSIFGSGSLSVHAFRRAPGFMDVVCYTSATGGIAVPHNLGVVPELVISKPRGAWGGNNGWSVWSLQTGTNVLYVNTTSAATKYWAATPAATSSNVYLDSQLAGGGTAGTKFVACLFTSLPGIQWINSYVGDGTIGRVINCGFTTGARFVMVKATSTTGSWWVFDSARGIVSAADPALQLNSIDAEVTSADAIDPHSSGFIVNQEATCSLNASGVSYLVWAIA